MFYADMVLSLYLGNAIVADGVYVERNLRINCPEKSNSYLGRLAYKMVPMAIAKAEEMDLLITPKNVNKYVRRNLSYGEMKEIAANKRPDADDPASPLLSQPKAPPITKT